MTQPTAYGSPLVTGEAVALEIRTAGIGSRGIAVVIDFAVQFAAFFVLAFFIAAVGATADSAAGLTIVLVFYVLVVLGYPVALESLWQGRTLGKAAMGLRVVRDDGGPIRFRHAFVRGLVGVVIERPGALFGLPALFCMLFNQRSKRLGDLAAGTVVVQDRVPAHVGDPVSMPPWLSGWAQSLDLARIDDAIAMRVRQFLSRAQQLAPGVREQMGAQLANEVAARTSLPPQGTPAWAYLAAVLAERRRRELLRSPPPAVAPPRPLPPPPAPPSTPAPPPPAAAPSEDDEPRGGFAPPR